VPEIAIADTGPLVHLAEIGEAGQLDIFDAVIVTEQVNVELIRHGVGARIAETLGNRFRVSSVSRSEMRTKLAELSRLRLHRADISTAALAARVKPDVVLTDDLRLRKALESQGFLVVGSIGVVFRALRLGRLGKRDAINRLDQLLDDSSLYASKAFRVSVRKILDEYPG